MRSRQPHSYPARSRPTLSLLRYPLNARALVLTLTAWTCAPPLDPLRRPSPNPRTPALHFSAKNVSPEDPYRPSIKSVSWSWLQNALTVPERILDTACQEGFKKARKTNIGSQSCVQNALPRRGHFGHGLPKLPRPSIMSVKPVLPPKCATPSRNPKTQHIQHQERQPALPPPAYPLILRATLSRPPLLAPPCTALSLPHPYPSGPCCTAPFQSYPQLTPSVPLAHP